MYHKLIYLIAICTLLIFNNSFAQKRATADVYADDIKAKQLEKHLEVLASDEYAGREAGTKGEQMAAQYMAKHYKKLGLKAVGENNSYFQKIPLNKKYWKNFEIKANGKKFEFLKDFYAFSRSAKEIELKTNEVIFAGYGISESGFNNYSKLDFKNKVVMILDGEPKDNKGNSIFDKKQKYTEWSTNWRKKLLTAKANGVELVLVVKKNIEKNVKQFKHSIEDASVKLDLGETESPYAQVYYISEEMAKTIAGKKYDKIKSKINKKASAKKAYSKALKTNLKIELTKKVREMNGLNVFAFIEGTDLKEEVIVLTGHYDHLGVKNDKIYNGADDNGTGTVALMEIAESFAQAKKDGNGPRRSILIFNNSAEEKGLLGSKYYVENPLFDLDKTIACLNIDMIGRVDKAHRKKKDENYVYIIGSDFLSTDLHKVNEMANKDFVKLNLDYKFNTYDDPNRFYYRSDHYNFVEKGIPSIFYFSGVHEDYHKHTDTEDKINYKKILIGLFFMAIGFNKFNPLPNIEAEHMTPKRIKFYRLGGMFVLVIGLFNLMKAL